MLNQKINIKIDGQNFVAQTGETILQVARKNKIDIPSLCYHPDLKVQASCRLCVVEIAGVKGLQTSCMTKVFDGMDVKTKSPQINKARQINLELIFAQHVEECDDCVWLDNCKLLKLAREYKVKIPRFVDRKQKFPVHQFGQSLIFDSKKCIDCGLCVEMCHRQGVDFLERQKKGNFFQVEPSKDPKKDCIYCGQCLVHCPVGAFEAVGEFEAIEKFLKQKNKVVVFQFAPSVRVSIGEEFGLEHGSIVTDQLVGAIKQLGVNYVFDVSVAADTTTIEEAGELLERLKTGKNLPMFTACCPGWVRYVEYFFPEFIPNLTTVRSPQMIMGGLIKTYWAKQQKIDPKNIYVVSVMPCVAKKTEIERPELKIKGIKPVDYVMTTRELARLLKKKNINLTKVKKQPADCPLGEPTGAGVIYGTTGGVMESALRSALYQLTGKKMAKPDFKAVRGNKDIKTAEVKIADKKLKIAVVNGNGNAYKILDELKQNPKAYDYIEVMACPGGCIGGGGQPMPVDDEIRQKRINSLYEIDQSKKIRLAEDSPIIQCLYRDFLVNKKDAELICHTRYYKQKKGNRVLKG
ncbi:MAG: [FeFe] hydrogenase, group A [Patescibacteria group bacterium]